MESRIRNEANFLNCRKYSTTTVRFIFGHEELERQSCFVSQDTCGPLCLCRVKRPSGEEFISPQRPYAPYHHVCHEKRPLRETTNIRQTAHLLLLPSPFVLRKETRANNAKSRHFVQPQLSGLIVIYSSVEFLSPPPPPLSCLMVTFRFINGSDEGAVRERLFPLSP